MKNHRHHGLKLAVAACTLAASVLGGSLVATRAHAIYVVCSTDPILQLSNGKQLSISATIGDSASDVRSVSYAVQLPTGVTVTKTNFTGGRLVGKESLSVTSTNAAGSYGTSTTVLTGASGVSVKASASLTGSSRAASGSASGFSGQALSITLQSS